MLVVFIWLMAFQGIGPMSVTPLWHAHEMLVGFGMAAVAGFSLTAVANWTGRTAIHGALLAWLVGSWLLGRLAMLMTGWLPASLAMTLDSLFPTLLCVLLGKEIISAHSRRNYPIVAITALLASLNMLYHLGAGGWLPGMDRTAIFLFIHTILILVTIIAGRIIPVFTGNWLRSQGKTLMPVNSVVVNIATVLLTVLVGLSATYASSNPVTGLLAFAAAFSHGYRLARWKGLSTTSNPLLFVLHVAYLWLPVGYALLGCAVFGWLITPTSALHALTMGAISSMILAVTTRVALGHTGRPLLAARATIVSYWVLMFAVVLRVLGPLVATDNYLQMIDLSALAWMLAFGIFIWVYWPILTRRKSD